MLSREVANPAVHLMREFRRLREHHNALAVHGVDAVRLAKLERIFRFCSLLDPYAFNPGFSRLADDAFRFSGRNNEDRATHVLGKGKEIGIATLAGNGTGVWIHRKHAIAFVLEIMINRIAEFLPSARNADNSQRPLREKCVDGRIF